MALDRQGWRPGVRGVAAALLPPAMVTAIAASSIHVSTTSAGLAYVLAVVVAAAWGGLGPGLASALLSFLALNYFFTPPLNTLVVGETEDVVALAVFLAVSVTVGTLLSRVLDQRARADQQSGHEVAAEMDPGRRQDRPEHHVHSVGPDA